MALFTYRVTTGCLTHGGIIRSCSEGQAIMDVQRKYEGFTNYMRDSIKIEEIKLEEGQMREMKCERTEQYYL